MTRVALATVAVALFAAQPAIAQDLPQIRPGDAAIDVFPVRAGADTLAIFVIEGEEAFAIGQYVIETTIEGGRITRSDRMLGLQDEVLWGEHAILEDRTLRPIGIRSQVASAHELTFDDGMVTREWVEDGVAHSATAESDAPAFHPTSIDFVIRSLPLAAGYAANLVVIDLETLGENLLPVHVEREVVVQDVNGRSYTTWEVHLDLGGAVDVYHFEQDSGALIRYESALDALVMLRW